MNIIKFEDFQFKDEIKKVKWEIKKWEAALKEFGVAIAQDATAELKLYEEQLVKLEVDDKNEKNDKSTKIVLEATKFIQDNNVNYVADENVFYVKKNDSYLQWSKEAFYTYLMLINKDDKDAINYYLQQTNRFKQTKVTSFRQLNDVNVLNTLSTKNWIKPAAAPDVHVMFDIILDTLSNNNAEAKEYIEKIIGWKYLHPEEYRLPMSVFYGVGGAGKNTFVSQILATIFTDPQISVLSADSIFGNFNDGILGKAVVLIDEALSDKRDINSIKALICNKNIEVNEKFGKKTIAENTALYFMSGNARSVSYLVSGDSADRRFSLIKIERNLFERIQERFECDNKTASEFFFKNENVFTNATEVAKWLQRCVNSVKDLTTYPAAYHNQNYYDSVEEAKNPIELICENIFSENFQNIKTKDLYEYYTKYSKTYYPNNRIISINKFGREVSTYLENKHLSHIVNNSINSGKHKAWLNSNILERTFASNRNKLYDVDGNVESPKLEIIWNKTKKESEKDFDNIIKLKN